MALSLIAALPAWLEWCFIYSIPVIALALLVFVPVAYLTGGFNWVGRSALARRFEGIDIRSAPIPGDVAVRYHTYRGFVIYFICEEFRFFSSPPEARKLLGRLLRFNLTWGLPTWGILFIPAAAIINYYVQLRSIAAQQAQNELNPNLPPIRRAM